MRAAAQTHRINVGLAAPDGDEMVYLESIRYNPRPSLRSVVSGQRVPMELTSLGRACLAGVGDAHRAELLAHFRGTRKGQWRQMGAAVRQSIEDVQARGWCAASWQPEVVAVATPLQFQGAVYALNMSVTTAAALDPEAQRLALLLLQLKLELEAALALSAVQ